MRTGSNSAWRSALAVAVVVAACSSEGGRLADWTVASEQVKGPPKPAGAIVAEPAPRVVAVPSPPFDVGAPSDPVVSIGRGDHHACAVRASGAVDCWGQTTYCQRDPCGELVADPTVRRVPDLADATTISADGRCVIRRDKTLACIAFGRLAFEPVAGIADVRAIDNASRCAIVGSGTLACRTYDPESKFVRTRIGDAVAVATGYLVSCAVRRGGTIACGDVDRFVDVQGLSRVRAIALDGQVTTRLCAIVDNATTGKPRVRCFGADGVVIDRKFAVYERGLDHDYDYRLRDPEPFVGATMLTMSYPGRENTSPVIHALVDGKVVTTDLDREAEAHVLPELADAVQLIHGCAIRRNGSVACWGKNDGGMLAQPTTIGRTRLPPTTVVGVSDVVAIGAGFSQTWALTRDNRLFGWGGWRYEIDATPKAVPLGVGPSNLVELAVLADGQACVRSTLGAVWCHVEQDRLMHPLDTERAAKLVPQRDRMLVLRTDGVTERYQLSARGLIESPWLEELPALRGVRDVSGSIDDQPCAIERDGAVRCMKREIAIANASALAGGREFHCALHDGRVSCWLQRMDRYGSREPPTQPFAIERVERATQLAASQRYACAVFDGGRVGCWYFVDENDEPVDVAQSFVQVIPSGATRIALGQGVVWQLAASRGLHGPQPAGEYGCAIMVDRSVQCWGSNHFGELGDGSVHEVARPIGVRL